MYEFIAFILVVAFFYSLVALAFPPLLREIKRKNIGIFLAALIILFFVDVALAPSSPQQSQKSPIKSVTVSPTLDPLAQWNEKNGSILLSLYQDSQNISDASSNNDFQKTLSACKQFKKDTDYGLTLPAIPNTEASIHFQAALTFYNQAANDCVNGITDNNPDLITNATKEMNQGTSEIHLVSEVLK